MKSRTTIRVIGESPKQGRLSVYFEQYKGQWYLHVRYWVLDKKTQQWIPGVKGVGIPGREVPLLLEELGNSLSEFEQMYGGGEGGEESGEESEAASGEVEEEGADIFSAFGS